MSGPFFLRADETRHDAFPDALYRIEVPPGARLTIGRSAPADILVVDPSVARRHAVVENGERGWTIDDTHSPGGTFVNYQRISSRQPTAIGPGDEIRVGGVYLFVHERAPLPANDKIRFWMAKLSSNDRDERWTAAQRLSAVHVTSASGRRKLSDALAPAIEDDYEPVRRWARRARDRLAPIRDDPTMED